MFHKKLKDLPSGINPQRLPRHIAVIMDGNGRWAKKRNLPRIEGHRAGSRAVREMVETCARIGIPVLTVFAFSTENWNRPKDEVNSLMELLSQYIDKERKTIIDNKLRFKMIGRSEGLGKDILNRIHMLETETASNTGMMFCLALNYSGRTDIMDCMNKIIMSLRSKIGTITIDENMINQNLYTVGIPDPDLLIRTSGEMRISNFLLWQIAYSEIWITDVLWPDFKPKHLFQAIKDFQKRDRRFGEIKE